MFLETEGREVDTVPKDTSFGQDTDASHTVNFHFHIWVTVRIPQVGQVWPPSGVLGITFDNHSVLIQRVSQGQSGL